MILKDCREEITDCMDILALASLVNVERGPPVWSVVSGHHLMSGAAFLCLP